MAYANAERREALCEQYFALWTPSAQLEEGAEGASEPSQSLQDRREAIAQQTQARHALHILMSMFSHPHVALHAAAENSSPKMLPRVGGDLPVASRHALIAVK